MYIGQLRVSLTSMCTYKACMCTCIYICGNHTLVCTDWCTMCNRLTVVHTICLFHLLFTLRVFFAVCLLPGLQWLPVHVSTCTACTSGAHCLSGTCVDVHVCVWLYTVVLTVDRYILPLTTTHHCIIRLGIQINTIHRLAIQLYFDQHNMCVKLRLPLSHA